LPEPVLDMPSISFPCKIAGIACCCTGVGCVNDCSPIAFNNGADKPNAENAIFFFAQSYSKYRVLWLVKQVEKID
jgi:hypothetical protein